VKNMTPSQNKNEQSEIRGSAALSSEVLSAARLNRANWIRDSATTSRNYPPQYINPTLFRKNSITTSIEASTPRRHGQMMTECKQRTPQRSWGSADCTPGPLEDTAIGTKPNFNTPE
jgi:hypothetical protein